MRGITKSPDDHRTGARSTVRNLIRNLTPGVLTMVAIEHGHTIYLALHTVYGGAR